MNFAAEVLAYRQMYENAAMGIQLEKVLRDYIRKTQHLTFQQREADYGVFDENKILLFTSVSFPACVEFALAQPELKGE